MDMNIILEKGNNISMENIKFQKMLFIFNAVNDGWSVRKENDLYIFKKGHEGKKEYFKDDYLSSFMGKNFNIDTLIKNKQEL
jgi:hypothetical protein